MTDDVQVPDPDSDFDGSYEEGAETTLFQIHNYVEKLVQEHEGSSRNALLRVQNYVEELAQKL